MGVCESVHERPCVGSAFDCERVRSLLAVCFWLFGGKVEIIEGEREQAGGIVQKGKWSEQKERVLFYGLVATSLLHVGAGKSRRSIEFSDTLVSDLPPFESAPLPSFLPSFLW